MSTKRTKSTSSSGINSDSKRKRKTSSRLKRQQPDPSNEMIMGRLKLVGRLVSGFSMENCTMV